ncbi:MAG: peroxiredoxin family protein [Bacteroidales bacterium]|nr:peroxiredoxin family protein [Bacteroidales bacterium]MCF8333161.1 peroxiredoxin family protein [Bacteroidales bacterium]
MKTRLVPVIILLLILGSCTREEEKSSGKIILAIESKVPFTGALSLIDIRAEGKQTLFTMAPDTKRVLKKEFPAERRKLLALRGGDSFTIPLSAAPGDTIKVTLYDNSLSDYDISGSKESRHLGAYQKTYAAGKKNVDSLMKRLYESTRQGNYGSTKKAADSLHRKTLKNLQSRGLELIQENTGNLGNILILNRYLGNQRILNPEHHPRLFEKADSAIMQHFASHPLAIQFHKQVSRRLEELRKDQKREARIKEGAPAPEISAPTAEGKKISLEGFKGHPVLLVFWAAKSEKAVEKLNRLKKIYQNFHPAGFEIFAISVDNNRQLWQRATRDSIYPWINANVTGWLSAPQAKRYAVDSLPASFLINKTGIIESINPDPTELPAKLETITKQ